MRILKLLSGIVVIGTVFCLFGYFVLSASKRPAEYGQLGQTILDFVQLPGTFMEVLSSNEIQNIPPDYVQLEEGFEELNKLDYPLYALNSYYSAENNSYDIVLSDLQGEKNMLTWVIRKADIDMTNSARQFASSPPRNCIIYPDSSLVCNCNRTFNVYKLDKESNIKWITHDVLTHHALNPDHNMDIWVCTAQSREILTRQKDKKLKFQDDRLTKINHSTGEVVFDKSITDIFIDNGLGYLVFGQSNLAAQTTGNDPIHLNDIQPCTYDSEYWKTGDVFVSIRHRSMIFQYRPSTNEVVRIIQGAFLNQHDVDIISNHEIAIFNNNASNLGWGRKLDFDLGGVASALDSLSGSEVVVYNFQDSTFTTPLKSVFESENMWTRTQGMQEVLSNGDIWVESQNNGKVYVLSDEGVKLRKVFKTNLDGWVERPHWIRIYEDLDSIFVQ